MHLESIFGATMARVTVWLAFLWLGVGLNLTVAASDLGSGGGQVAPQSVSPPDSAICTNITLPDPADQPPQGHWWNPQRFGIGWQSVIKREIVAGQPVGKLQMYWFTYRSNGRPVWYSTDFLPFSGDTWSGALYRRDPFGGAHAAGHLAIRTVPEHPERLAVSWVRSHGLDQQATDQECIVDLLRSQPLNDFELPDRAVDSAYGGVWSEPARPSHTLNFVMNNGGSDGYVELLIPAFYDMANEPVWLWGQHPNGHGTGDINGLFTHALSYTIAHYPPQGSCAAGDPTGCISYLRLNGESGRPVATVARQFTTPFTGTALINICGTDGAACAMPLPNSQTHQLRGWNRPTVPIEKLDPTTLIEVNRYACDVDPGASSCAIAVNWAITPSQPASIWRVTTHAPGGTPPAPQWLANTTSHGSLSDGLPAWLTVRYEVRSGSTYSGELLAATPHVRTYGEVPDEAVEPLGTPDHSAGHGAVAGQAGTAGGAATYEIPIRLPPGRNGMAPELALVYSSRSGNGVAGIGWSLSGSSSIHRCPQTVAQDGRSRAVMYDGEDRLCLDGQRLVPIEGSGGMHYRTEIDRFLRVIRTGGLAPRGGTYFTVRHKDGTVDHYGSHPNGGGNGGHVPEGAPAPLSWALVLREDPHGNRIRYSYATPRPGEYLLANITYTGDPNSQGDRQVIFIYEPRPAGGGASDVTVSYLSGGRSVQSQRLQRIEVRAPLQQSSAPAVGQKVAEYFLSYGSPSARSGRSLLRAVTECRRDNKDSADMICLPATQFHWQDGPIAGNGQGYSFEPFALESLLGPARQQTLSMPRIKGFSDEDDSGAEPGTSSVVRPNYLVSARSSRFDLDGDGVREALVGVLNADGLTYSTSLVSFSADRQIQHVLPTSQFDAELNLAWASFEDGGDFNNDGRHDWLGVQNWAGGQRLVIGVWNPAGSWAQNRFTAVPVDNVPLQGYGTIKVADVNGDGWPDIVVTRPVNNCSGGFGASSGELGVFVHLNQRLPAGSGSIAFAQSPASGPVTCLQSWTHSGYPYSESLLELSDFDGNGLADLHIGQPIPNDPNVLGYLNRIVFMSDSGTGLSGQSVAFSNLGTPGDAMQPYETSPLSFHLFMDVNGDGLADFVHASNSGGGNPHGKQWVVRLNTGGRLGPRMPTGTHRGLEYCAPGTVPGSCVPRHASFIKVMDVSGDGRQELLVPERFAVHACTYHYEHPPTGQCRGSDEPGPSGLTPCERYYLCSEDPRTGQLPAGTTGYLGIPVVGLYQNGQSFDQSAYFAEAIGFSLQQAGANSPLSMGATTRPLDIVLDPYSQSLDLYGDGLEDHIVSLECAGRGLVSGAWPSCLVSAPTSHIPNPSVIATFVAEGIGVERRFAGSGQQLSPKMPELLELVTDGMGREAMWEYFPLTSSAGRHLSFGRQPLYRIPARDSGLGYVDDQHFYFASSMNVVASLSTSNGLGDGINLSEYSYAEAMYNNAGRGFQGFRTIVEDRTIPGATPMRTATRFHQKYPLTGLVEASELRTRFEQPFATSPPALESTYNDWRTHPDAGFPYLKSSEVEKRDTNLPRDRHTLIRRHVGELLGNIPLGVTLYGDVEEETVVTEDEFSIHTQVRTNTYSHPHPAPGTWWVGRLDQTTEDRAVNWKVAPVPDGSIPLQQGLTVNYLYDPGSNARRKPVASIEVASGDGNWRRTDFSYDGFGNLIAQAVHGGYLPEGASRRTVFDFSDSWGYFPTRVTAVLGPNDSSAENHVTTAVYEPRSGMVLNSTDANGLTTTNIVDAFGRVTRTDSPGAPPLHIGRMPCGPLAPCGGVPNAVYRIETRQDGAPITVTYFDLLDRELGTDQRGLHSQGRIVRTLRAYNARGLVSQESQPHFVNDPVHWTVFGTYDVLNRLLSKTTPTEHGPRQTTYVYDGLTTRISAQAPQAAHGNLLMERTHSAAGLLLETVDAQGGRTSYRYDGAGNPVLIQSPEVDHGAGPVRPTITATYNGFGHRLSSTDPDRGAWAFLYNAANELVQQGDGRGWLMRWEYDRLGRKTKEFEHRAETDPYGTVGERQLHAWDWDGAGAKGLPHMTRRISPFAHQANEYVQVFEYDAFNRLSRESVNIKERVVPEQPFHNVNNPYLVDLTWDRRLTYHAHYGWLKQERRGQREDNQQISMGHGDYTQYWRRDRYGHVVLEGGLREWEPAETPARFGRKVLAMDAYGNVTQAWLGNRASSSAPYPVEHSQHHPQTGQLHQRCVGVGAPGTCTVLALDYSYDGWGNLVHHSQGGGAPAAAETLVYDSLHRLQQATRNGHGTVSYQYDAVGNLRSKSDFSSGTNAYTYGSSRPHAVTAVQQAAGTRVYAYDGNGNMVGRGLNTITQELKYDSHNRPERLLLGLSATVPVRTEFRYAPGGDRYLQRKRRGTQGGSIGTPSPYPGSGLTEDYLILYPFQGFEVDLRRGSAGQTVAGLLGVRQVLGGWGMRHARNTGHLPRVLWDHRDRLGSVVARTREDGQVASRPEQLYGGATPGNGQHERFGFDAFGKPRTGSWADSGGSMGEPHPGSNGALFSAVSLRGFTDHEHLDDEKLIHMNGRLYDPLLGRFLSVDPIIQFPENSQSLNPYSYILNNPMSGTDPTGYCSAPVGSNIRICDMEVKQIYTDGSSRSMKFNSRNEADMSRAAAVVAGAISQMLKGNGSEGQGARADAGGRSHDRVGDRSALGRDFGLSRSEQRGLDRSIDRWMASEASDTSGWTAHCRPCDADARMEDLYRQGKIGADELYEYRRDNATNALWAAGGMAVGAMAVRVLGGGFSWILRRAGAPRGIARSLDDVGSLHGASADDVGRLIPQGWASSATRRGDGIRYANPSRRGEQVRVMHGNPRDPNPVKQGPYLRISRDGVVTDPIPLAGNPTLR